MIRAQKGERLGMEGGIGARHDAKAQDRARALALVGFDEEGQGELPEQPAQGGSPTQGDLL